MTTDAHLFRWFVSAPRLTVSPRRMVEGLDKPAGPGYLVVADSRVEAVAVTKAFRKGEQWSLDLVEVVR